MSKQLKHYYSMSASDIDRGIGARGIQPQDLISICPSGIEGGFIVFYWEEVVLATQYNNTSSTVT